MIRLRDLIQSWVRYRRKGHVLGSWPLTTAWHRCSDTETVFLFTVKFPPFWFALVIKNCWLKLNRTKLPRKTLPLPFLVTMVIYPTPTTSSGAEKWMRKCCNYGCDCFDWHITAQAACLSFTHWSLLQELQTLWQTVTQCGTVALIWIRSYYVTGEINSSQNAFAWNEIWGNSCIRWMCKLPETLKQHQIKYCESDWTFFLSLGTPNCEEQLRRNLERKTTAHNPSNGSDTLSRDYLISCPA